MGVRGRRMNPKKKILMIGGIVFCVLVIIFIILYAINTNNKTKQQEPITVGEKILLSDTIYEGMSVTDIQMSYLTQNNETLVTFEIKNSTSSNVENESLNAILKDEKGNELAKTTTFIKSLASGESYRINVVLRGNLTATKKIELKKI